MGKDKIRKFKENETFRCLIQPPMNEVLGKEHPLKGNWDKEVFHNGNPIVLELGCGKGEYTIALAERFPEKNFIARVPGSGKERNTPTSTICRMWRFSVHG